MSELLSQPKTQLEFVVAKPELVGEMRFMNLYIRAGYNRQVPLELGEDTHQIQPQDQQVIIDGLNAVVVRVLPQELLNKIALQVPFKDKDVALMMKLICDHGATLEQAMRVISEYPIAVGHLNEPHPDENRLAYTGYYWTDNI